MTIALLILLYLLGCVVAYAYHAMAFVAGPILGVPRPEIEPRHLRGALLIYAAIWPMHALLLLRAIWPRARGGRARVSFRITAEDRASPVLVRVQTELAEMPQAGAPPVAPDALKVAREPDLTITLSPDETRELLEPKNAEDVAAVRAALERRGWARYELPIEVQ